jgi:hypothetical protein
VSVLYQGLGLHPKDPPFALPPVTRNNLWDWSTLHDAFRVAVTPEQIGACVDRRIVLILHVAEELGLSAELTAEWVRRPARPSR